MIAKHASLFTGLALALALSAISHAVAEPITSVTGLNNFRDRRGLNDVGILQGDVIQFGADVVPNGAAGTTMTASQGARRLGPSRCVGLAVDANFCAFNIAFDQSLRGAWTLTFQNGSDKRVETTPPLDLPPQTPLPFPVSVTLSGAGLQPTISFVVPDDFDPNGIRLVIYDKDDRLANGQANVIHNAGFPGTTRSFTVPATLSSGRALKIGGNYALNVQLIETRGHGAFTNQQSQILQRSSSFFSFAPRTDELVVHLPTVGPDGVYRFAIVEVSAGQITYIDPPVAVGYDYATGPGDPNFESVKLPRIGGKIVPFTLSFLSGGVIVETQTSSDDQYFFPSGGVSTFSVRGIEASARLDPSNASAFATGLTFVADGAFTGTMTPVTEDLPPSLLTLEGAEAWIGLRNSDDVGTRFDLRAEVYADGELIGSGELPNVAGGSSGFGNARRSAIPLSLSAPLVSTPPGTSLSVKLSARITCSGPTHASGIARLWFNDAQAASGVRVAIDEVGQSYFLRPGSMLASSTGTGPKTVIDRLLDSKVACSKPGGRPFTSFGSWGLSLP